MPCCKGATLQIAHGLVMHHATMPPHEELWTSASPLHSLPVLFHGALLGCKLGRLWRMPCSKGAKPQRAHGLAMHHAIMPPHEELQTSAPCRGRGEDAGGWLCTRRKPPPASLNIILEFDSRSTKHLVLETCGGGMGTPAPSRRAFFYAPEAKSRYTV